WSEAEPELVFPLPELPLPSKREGPVPDGGLSRRWLDRILAISDHLRVADGMLREAQRLPPGDHTRDVADWILGRMVDQPLALRKHPRGRGRPPLDDALLIRVADAYVQAIAQGSAEPCKRVAARLRLTPNRARGLVHQARKRGWLTEPGLQGVAGGALTPAAKALLVPRPARAQTKTRRKTKRRR